MITPMVKYDFLLYHRDLNSFLEKLQELGMIHVESRNVEVDDETNKILQKADSFDKIHRALKAIKVEKDVAPFTGDANTLAERYVDVKDKISKFDAAIKKAEKDIDEAIPWGDFNQEDLDKIAKLGLKPRFYSVPVKQFSEDWVIEYPLYEISRDKGKIYFVILQESPDFHFDQQEVKPPAVPHKVLLEDLKEYQAEYEKYTNELESLVLAAQKLPEERKRLLEQIDYNIAKLSAQNEAEGSIKHLTGWLPKDKQTEFNKFLNEQGIVYFAEEKIADDEEPPILLKNNAFAKLYEPITRLYSLPNYRELDPTPFFAPFFMLFFGFCLGDGGYGLVIALVATLLKFKIKDPSVRAYLSLAQWLGFATIIFGFITATFFGISIDPIKLDRIVEQKFGLQENYGMMFLSLIVGFIQIIFGMLLNVAKITKQKGFKYALGTLSWVFIILGGAALFLFKNSDNPLVYALYGICGLALLIAFFYNSPGKNPLINFGSGIWDTYNVASGLLGDLLSYIRLFALGLTGGILGGVFNTLAMDAASGIGIPVVAQLIALIVLVFGHGLNFMLNALGAVVHPIRLTFVEFYKNSGFEGNGLPFKFFRKSINNN